MVAVALRARSGAEALPCLLGQGRGEVDRL